MNEIIKYLQSSIDEKAEVKKWNAKEHLNLQLAGRQYVMTSTL